MALEGLRNISRRLSHISHTMCYVPPFIQTTSFQLFVVLCPVGKMTSGGNYVSIPNRYTPFATRCTVFHSIRVSPFRFLVVLCAAEKMTFVGNRRFSMSREKRFDRYSHSPRTASLSIRKSFFQPRTVHGNGPEGGTTIILGHVASVNDPGVNCHVIDAF